MVTALVQTGYPYSATARLIEEIVIGGFAFVLFAFLLYAFLTRYRENWDAMLRKWTTDARHPQDGEQEPPKKA